MRIFVTEQFRSRDAKLLSINCYSCFFFLSSVNFIAIGINSNSSIPFKMYHLPVKFPYRWVGIREPVQRLGYWLRSGSISETLFDKCLLFCAYCIGLCGDK